MQYLTITLQLPEIYYQVALDAHLMGEVDLSQDKDARAVSLSQIEVEEEGKEVLLRAVKASDAHLRHQLHLYLVEEQATIATDNMPQDAPSLSYILGMPDQFFPPSLRDMQEAMHHYIVHMCLSEWYTLMKNEQGSMYAQLAQADLKRLGQASSRRIRPVRPLNPYQ